MNTQMENQTYLKRPDFTESFLWKGAAGPGFLWEVCSPEVPPHSSPASDSPDYFLGGTDNQTDFSASRSVSLAQVEQLLLSSDQ